jgi:hypothetical protein
MSRRSGIIFRVTVTRPQFRPVLLHKGSLAQGEFGGSAQSKDAVRGAFVEC